MALTEQLTQLHSLLLKHNNVFTSETRTQISSIFQKVGNLVGHEFKSLSATQNDATHAVNTIIDSTVVNSGNLSEKEVNILRPIISKTAKFDITIYDCVKFF